MRIRAVLLFLLIVPALLFAEETTDSLAAKLAALDREIDKVDKQIEQEKSQNSSLISNSDSSDENLRLAYESAERLDSLNTRSNELRERRITGCEKWRVLYAVAVDDLLGKAHKEQNPGKRGEMGKRLQLLQKQNARFCPATFSDNLPQEWRSIRAESYDGPKEIQQKMQLLRDISREVQIRLANLDRQLETMQKERKTKERAEEFLQESTLFTDNIAVRRGTGADTTQGSEVPRLESTTATPEIVNREEIHGKESLKKFEDRYQQQKSDLLQQQKDLLKKLAEFETRARELEIR